MLRTVLMSIIAVMVAACTAPLPADQPATGVSASFIGVDGKPLVSPQGIIDNTVQEALTANPDACAKAGGSLVPVCRMQRPMCLIHFSDAGKACSDGADCASGRCRAGDTSITPGKPATGICAKTNDPCGCYTRIEDGVAQPTICVD